MSATEDTEALVSFCLVFLLLFLFDVDLRLRVWMVSLQRDLGLVTCRKKMAVITAVSN